MPDPTAEHKLKILEQFTLQAVPFARSHGHSESIQLMIDLAGVSAVDNVLDVACGLGLVACEFARHAGHVTGIDLTPGMIAQAEKRQRDQKLENISWHIGDVLALPFPDSVFSIVLTRYSFHHFLDPGAVLAEMIRVCRPAGRVMVVDTVLPADKVDAYNRLEIIRDPSHVKSLSLEEMESVIGKSGLIDIRTEWYMFEGELEEMLSRSFPNPGDENKIRNMFNEDLGTDRMGIGVHKKGDTIRYSIPILIVIGTKP